MKSNFYTAIFFLFLAIASTSEASIHERIDKCEASGGGSCVYTILRELAGDRPVASKCTCTTEEAEVSSDCFMKQEYSLKIDGRLIKTGCGDNSDMAYINCLNAMKQHELCH